MLRTDQEDIDIRRVWMTDDQVGDFIIVGEGVRAYSARVIIGNVKV